MSLTQTRRIRYVVFTGPSKSGKTTAAGLLVSAFRQLGRTAMQASFELPMKQYLSGLLARRPKEDEVIGELLNKTRRDFLNLEAMHMRFHYGPGVLGKLLLARSKRWLHAPQYVIVDDGTSVLDCRELGRYFIVQVMRDRVERVYPFRHSKRRRVY